MNRAIGMAAAFIFGAAAGAAGAWYVCKTKYERIAQEEIDSVKEVFSEKMKHTEEKKQEGRVPVDIFASDGEAMKNFQNEYGYKPSFKKPDNLPKVQDDRPRPYIVTPDEYGDQDGYELIELIYYRDHILVTSVDNEIVEDVDDIVGFESFNHFGENKDYPDQIYIRNDEHQCDYEIVRDSRTYEESRNDY